MKNILFVTHSMGHGGLNETLINATRIIDKSKYNIELFLLYDIRLLQDKLPENISVTVNEVSSNPRKSIVGVFYYIVLQLLKFIKANKLYEKLNSNYTVYKRNFRIKKITKRYFLNKEYDVVIAYSTGEFAFLASKIKAKKHCVFMHQSIDVNVDKLSNLYLKYDNLVAVSEPIAEIMRSNYPLVSDRVITVSNYVDVEGIIEKSKETNPYSTNNSVKICTCSRISVEKGIDLLVKSAKILKDRKIDFVWYVIGGDDGMQTELEEYLRENKLTDAVFFTGHLSNPYPYYRYCDIYVQPSYEEAQPLAIIEAQVFGKIIVSTNTVGGKYLLDNGKKGILTDFTPESISEALFNICDKKEYLKEHYCYTIEQNIADKQTYIDSWNSLLEK